MEIFMDIILTMRGLRAELKSIKDDNEKIVFKLNSAILQNLLE